MAMDDPLNPLQCYCGKPTRIYDSLFKRNFCSDECSNDLMAFLGGCDKSIEVVKEIEAGDFKIRGTTVVLSDTLIKYQVAKTASIDKIDAEVQRQLAEDKLRAGFRKLGMKEDVIDAMLKAKGAS